MPLELESSIKYETIVTSIKVESVMEDLISGELRIAYIERDASGEKAGQAKLYELASSEYADYCNAVAVAKEHWLSAAAAQLEIEADDIRHYIISTKEKIALIFADENPQLLDPDGFQEALEIASNAAEFDVYDAIKSALYSALPAEGIVA